MSGRSADDVARVRDAVIKAVDGVIAFDGTVDVRDVAIGITGVLADLLSMYPRDMMRDAIMRAIYETLDEDAAPERLQ